jgi:hypothetical protein
VIFITAFFVVTSKVRIKSFCALFLTTISKGFPLAFNYQKNSVEFDPLYKRTEQLKKDFLECDRLSRRVILDSDTAAFCSHVTEELRKTSFDGHFETLISWWRLATVR